MDYIQSSNKQEDKFGPGEHGFSAGNPTGGVPATFFAPEWADGVQQEPINVIKAAGLAPTAGVFTQLRQAVKRLFGGNVTTVNAAASPFALTADHAGVVKIDAVAGNVVVNLPAANVLAGLPFEFRRVDATANTVTINRAGVDTIDEGATSFTLASKAAQKIRSDGATAWSTMTPSAATKAETDAGTIDSKFVTPKNLRFGFAVLLAANGYIALPSWMGGVIFQWAAVVANTPAVSFTFPIAFPNAVWVVTGSGDSNAASRTSSFYSLNTTGGLVFADAGALLTKYIAIGH